MNTDATVLKLYPLGENGLIVVWCSEEGIIRTAAKGARKQSSPFAGRLDLFYQCRMQWTPAKTGDLHTLTTVDLISPRLSLRADYSRLSAAGYFARLFLQMLEPDTPIPEFYDLLQRHTPIWKKTCLPCGRSSTLNRNSPGCTAFPIPEFPHTSF